MEENLKFYSQKAIAIATYFGGPLAAGILIRRNCLNLGNEKQAVNSLIIGIISTIFIFVGIFMVPENIIEKIPNVIIPAIYTGIIYLIVEKIQGNVLKSHKEANGEFYSGWKAAGIGAVSMVIIAAGMFGYIMLSEQQYNYGNEIYSNEIDKFVQNEENALKVFQNMETGDKEYLLKEFNKGLVLWNVNNEIIDKVMKMDDIPTEMNSLHPRLKIYCELRIKHYSLIIKALSEDTDKYENEIRIIGLKIENILELLN